MATIRRTEKVASVIKRILSGILTSEIKDKTMGIVTITDVVMSKDLSIANVYFSVFGGTKRLDKQKHHVIGMVKYLRQRLAGKLTIRHIPKLHLRYDDTADKAQHIEKIFKKIRDENSEE